MAEIKPQGIVLIEVKDNTDLNFYFDLSTGQIIHRQTLGYECKIEVNEQSFNRLLSGDTTFEIEVNRASLKVSDQSHALRQFGKSIRQSKASN